MHDRLCLVTVHMKVLQNGRLVRFSKRTDFWCEFAGESVTKTATTLGVPRAAVSRVVTAYTNHGKTLSAERNSGLKPKLNVTDHSTWKSKR